MNHAPDRKGWAQGLVTTPAAIVYAFKRRRILTSVLAFFSIILLSTTLLRRHNLSTGQPRIHSPADLLKPDSPHTFDRATTNLHLLIPAHRPTAGLCKCLLSALVLGYPTPVLLNWGQIFNDLDPDIRDNGTHLAKITGASKYLRRLSRDDDFNLAVMVDAYDSFFQLPPKILTSRYRVENRANMDRTLETMGSRAVDAEGITQGILFSAQKDCRPRREPSDQLACYAQPESPLPTDLYGPGTDVLDPDSRKPQKFRPHFLGAGLVMGTVGSMLKLMLRAEEKIRTSDHKGSDQHIYNEIFAEQQYQREVMRERHMSWFHRAFRLIQRIIGAHTPTLMESLPADMHMQTYDGQPYEFGVGLDYRLQMSQSTLLSEEDATMLVFEDTDWLQSKPGPSPPRATALPKDIADLKASPYNALLTPDAAKLSINSAGWHQLPLYTNIWTGSVPAILHMNGDEGVRNATWQSMWFTHRADQWLKLAAFFHEDHKSVIAKDYLGKPVHWADTCGPFEKEVLGYSMTPRSYTES